MASSLTFRGTIRGLIRSPAFAAVAVATLALGSAVNAAVFGILDTVVLRPLPYHEPDRLLSVTTTFDGSAASGLPIADVIEIRDGTPMFEEVAWIARPSLTDAVTLTGAERERIGGAWVSASYFDVLGVAPHRGRLFDAGDDAIGGEPVVVLGHMTWQRRYGGAADAIGRTLEVNGVERTIVGVLGADFEALIDGVTPEVWLPYPLTASLDREAHILDVVARLAPGATRGEAAAALAGWNAGLAETYLTHATRSIVVESLAERWLSPARGPLLFLLAGSLIVLAVACVNLGILFAARNAARRREVALRLAIGAGWRNIAAPVISEIAIVALAGTAIGILLALAMAAGATALLPVDLPRFDGLRPSLRSLLFCASIALGSTILVGAWPVVRSLRLPAGLALRSRTYGGAGRWRGRLLIAIETAAVLVLLAGAGLATRGFVDLMQTDPGFTPEGRVYFDVTARTVGPENTSIPELAGRFESARQAALATPGVTGAGSVSNLPLTPASWAGNLRVDGRPDVNAAPILVDWEIAGPGYFGAAGIRMIEGREFEAGDRADAPLVAIVNHALAARWFPNGAIGQRISGEGEDAPWRTVVGVVSDVRQQSLGQDEVRPQMFIADAQSFAWPERKLVVATRAPDPITAAPAIRAAIAAAAPDLVIEPAHRMEELLDASSAQARFQSSLLGTFAFVALVLGLAGVFGVVSDSVQRRTSEIAVRKALGATDRRVLFGELRQGMIPVAAGAAVGVVLAFAGSRLIAARVHDLASADAITLGSIAAALLLVSAVAIAGPARRASRCDPGDVLRGGS